MEQMEINQPSKSGRGHSSHKGGNENSINRTLRKVLAGAPAGADGRPVWAAIKRSEIKERQMRL
jgi:hypothetical protein